MVQESAFGSSNNNTAIMSSKKTGDNTDPSLATKEETKEDRKRMRKEKKQKKQQILDEIPKVNEDGISYTKQQIRRMVKRVERGLPAVPTPAEEAELRKQEAKLRKEEELELAGILYRKNREKGVSEDENSDNDENRNGSELNEEPLEEQENRHIEAAAEVIRHGEPAREDEEDMQPKKKRKFSKKPVPDDYVCQACQNEHSPRHWIYDCPDKVTVPGTNRVSAGNQKGTSNNAPSAKKVFVSGLFFDSKPNDVKAIFASCGKITSCKLLRFPDTGRCKGQAFVVFDSEDAAQKALEMNGTNISERSDDSCSNNKKPRKDKFDRVKQDLELKVTRVISRALTKKTAEKKPSF